MPHVSCRCDLCTTLAAARDRRRVKLVFASAVLLGMLMTAAAMTIA